MAQSAFYNCRVVGGTLNMRSSIGGSVIKELPNNASLSILLENADEWFFASYTDANGTNYQGYVMARYIAVPFGIRTAYVVGGALNVRTRPSETATRIRQLPNNTQVEVVEERGTWTRISTSAGCGWVMSTYLGNPG